MIFAMITKNKITKNFCHYHHQCQLFRGDRALWRGERFLGRMFYLWGEYKYK